jgi:hypothetical protein
MFQNAISLGVWEGCVSECRFLGCVEGCDSIMSFSWLFRKAKFQNVVFLAVREAVIQNIILLDVREGCVFECCFPGYVGNCDSECRFLGCLGRLYSIFMSMQEGCSWLCPQEGCVSECCFLLFRKAVFQIVVFCCLGRLCFRLSFSLLFRKAVFQNVSWK